ncbi:hypothetical protein JAAARDRAFT_50447 [Jaapia argillacea MUCL 33604]|uniref:RTA1 like protein n=1 Tax=Jaapia argillacea MUCL 33604 TaxID=933084 RepID=A0A067PDR7_9AGAM|nr:hypothetical protein JAAARDRAFT_50447 [Jaapia argillacea MUCL 33604]
MAKCLTSGDPNAEYLYCASTGAAVLFAVLFGLTCVLHITQAIVYRKRFCWVIIMAAFWETCGFLTRALSSLDQTKHTFIFFSQLLILLAPLWINAFTYVVLGRMVYYFIPDQSVGRIKAKRLATWFVLLDITALLIQGTGGTLAMSRGNSRVINLGLHIYMGGIGMQEVFIVLFTGLAIRFHKKAMATDLLLGRSKDWGALLGVLYTTLILITWSNTLTTLLNKIRIIYRLVEFSSGVVNTLTTHEVFFYCLEAVPMFFAIFLYNIWHPGQVFVGPESEFSKLGGNSGRREGLGMGGTQETFVMSLIPAERV